MTAVLFGEIDLKSRRLHNEEPSAVEFTQRTNSTKGRPGVIAPYDTDVYCVTCNKTRHVKAGEPIPFCCGRRMEILD
ncbi:MAG: hypothetical protein ACI4V3_00055 [Faecousia sp.]